LCDRVALIRDGSLASTGTVDEVVTPAHIRDVYGVEAEVLRHASGQRLVVPIGRARPRASG
jgi:iron complex transport system ATP-binding protein